MKDKTAESEDHWRKSLSKEQFEVTRRKGTERPFSGKYHDCKTPGLRRPPQGSALPKFRHQIQSDLPLSILGSIS